MLIDIHANPGDHSPEDFATMVADAGLSAVVIARTNRGRLRYAEALAAKGIRSLASSWPWTRAWSSSSPEMLIQTSKMHNGVMEAAGGALNPSTAEWPTWMVPSSLHIPTFATTTPASGIGFTGSRAYQPS